jgi:hypothetical protein
LQKTNSYLHDFAKSGLRTLLIATKIIEEDEYQDWQHRYAKAIISTSNKVTKINALADEME